MAAEYRPNLAIAVRTRRRSISGSRQVWADHEIRGCGRSRGTTPPKFAMGGVFEISRTVVRFLVLAPYNLVDSFLIAAGELIGLRKARNDPQRPYNCWIRSTLHSIASMSTEIFQTSEFGSSKRTTQYKYSFPSVCSNPTAQTDSKPC